MHMIFYSKFFSAIILVALSLVFGGCSNLNQESGSLFQRQPAVAVTHGEYKVQKGDSLYSIAWRFKRDYRELGRINKLSSPYMIKPGQIILLGHDINEIPSKMGFTGQTVVLNKPVYGSKHRKKPVSSKQKKVVRRYRAQSTKKAKSSKKTFQKPRSYSAPKSVKMYWRWPAGGRVIQKFSNTTVGKKGIEISGQRGDRVNAAENGKVVYSGNGLLGYGNLVIVKHNDSFLTAYAHNSKVIVKEGDNVKVGEKIAEIGSSGTDRNKLHFEIRREGKPINPLPLLPKR